MNNFTTPAQGRNAVATAAVSPRGLCNPWIVVPQTSCLAGSAVINAARLSRRMTRMPTEIH